MPLLTQALVAREAPDNAVRGIVLTKDIKRLDVAREARLGAAEWFLGVKVQREIHKRLRPYRVRPKERVYQAQIVSG